jgi:hypothetical protein
MGSQISEEEEIKRTRKKATCAARYGSALRISSGLEMPCSGFKILARRVTFGDFN